MSHSAALTQAASACVSAPRLCQIIEHHVNITIGIWVIQAPCYPVDGRPGVGHESVRIRLVRVRRAVAEDGRPDYWAELAEPALDLRETAARSDPL